MTVVDSGKYGGLVTCQGYYCTIIAPSANYGSEVNLFELVCNVSPVLYRRFTKRSTKKFKSSDLETFKTCTLTVTC